MRIKDLFGRGQPLFSFEFFPPRTDQGVANLYHTVEVLSDLKPSFVSVTYGAGGSTRERTVELVGKIKNEIGIEAMAHLTCVSATRSDLAGVLDRLLDLNIENVLALRGDPPEGARVFERSPGGFGHANELTGFIKANYDFCVGGACYPEAHVECRDRDLDLRNLLKKVGAGVDFLVTQLFFDNGVYFDFVARARSFGIDVPIVPGIMPITNVSQVQRFTSMCGASVPPSLLKRLESAGDEPERVAEVGIEQATHQCRGLLEGGAPGIHFYTLNKSPATREIFRNLRALYVV